MSLKIRRAAVLGAGVMGAQIATHLAAAGVRTYLLDLASDDEIKDPKMKKVFAGGSTRSARSILALEQLKKLKPHPLMSQNVLDNVICGNFDDDFSVLSEADWIIEAVVERMDIKKSIHKRISEVARAGVPISTNTSGIPLAKICDDLPEHYAESFLGTHFFNPPRYMKLVEIIPHDRSRPEIIQGLAQWIDERLGKGIVYACDTINFIANRIGVLAIQATLKHTNELGLNLETVDALTGPLIGHPKSASFRTMDVVGLDTFVHVANNVYNSVKDDPYYDYFATPQWISDLVGRGHVGQKSGSVGCYKKAKDASGKRTILAYRPEKSDYEEQQIETFGWQKEAKKIPNLYERLNFIFKQDDKGAQLLWRLHRDVFSYSALLLEEIAAGSPKSIDDGMRWGFNWEAGPFELWQGAGYDELLERMKADGAKLPKWADKGVQFYKPSPSDAAWELSGPAEQLMQPAGKHAPIPKQKHQYFLPKSASTKDPRRLLGNKSASLVDIGDGVCALVFHSKMNTLNAEMHEVIQQSVAKVGESFAGLVVSNDGANFSAGADLAAILRFIEGKDFQAIEDLIRDFQGTLQLLKFAPFPVVSCPHGLVLGGGCEVSLHADTQLLAGDTFAGLVEVGVGVIPAGGGCKELALRAYNNMARLSDKGDPAPLLQQAFMLIGMGQVSVSGQNAIEMGLYPNTARVSLSKDRLTDRAKGMVLEENYRGYVTPTPATRVAVLGDPGIQTFKMILYNMKEGRQVSEYDAFLGEMIATVLCGGDIDAGSVVSEQHFLDLERNCFTELCRQQKTKDRIEHMLKTGKPLRN